MVKVGYLKYWVMTVGISILGYFCLKLVLYYVICRKLGFGAISQPLPHLPIIGLLVLGFVLGLVYQHIQRIYTNPLS